MARPKKNKIEFGNVIEVCEPSKEICAIEVDIPEVSSPLKTVSETNNSVCCFCDPAKEINKLVMEAPEVFLDEDTLDIDMTNRNLTNNNSIKTEVNAVANEKRGLSNIQVMRETAAKLRSKKVGRRSPTHRGHINARFSIH